MISKYDSPAQDKYINTYVPLPYEQIMATVASRQAQVDREQDMLNKTYEDTQNLKYIPGTKDEQYVRDYLGKTGSIVNKYFGADLSDPIVKQQMRTEFNNITDRTALQDIQTSYGNWAQNNKIKAQLKATGKYSEYLDQDPSIDPEFSSANGQVYNYTTPQFESYLPEAKAFWGNVKSSVLKDEKGNYRHTPEGYNISGYDPGEMKSYATLNWGTFDKTPTGNATITHILRSQGLDENNQDNRKAIATELLYNERPIGTSIEGSRTPEWQVNGGGNDNMEFENSLRRLPLRPLQKLDPFGVGDDVKFDESGNVDTRNYEPYGVSDRPAPGTHVGSDIQYTRDKEKEAIRKSEIEARLEFVRQKFPQFQGLPNKETYEAYQQLTNSAKAIEDVPAIDIPDNVRKGLASWISSHLSETSMQIRDGHGETDLTNSQDTKAGSVLKDVGWTPEKLSEELNKFASGKDDAKIKFSSLAGNGPKSGMIMFEMLDESKKGGKGTKGVWRKGLIDTNQTYSSIMSPSNDIYNAIRTFESATVLVGYDENENGVYVHVTPKAYKNPNTKKWEYDHSLQRGFIQNNEFVPTDDIEMEDILRAQHRLLKNTYETFTNINYTPPKSYPSSF